MTIKLVVFVIFMLTSLAAGAASVTYVITDDSDSAHPRLIAQGTTTYSERDITVIESQSNGTPSWSESLLLGAGFSIGASIYAEEHVTGFGMWAHKCECDFSWEWFDINGDGSFDKLQEKGKVQVTFRGQPYIEKIASITFTTDVSLRVNPLHKAGQSNHRVLIKKGSVLAFPP